MSAREITRLQRRVDALEAREGLLAGAFIQSATSAGDKLTVTVAGFDDGEHAFGEPEGIVWSPRVDDDGDAVFPSTGDAAWVMEASDGRWVVVAWEPA